MDHIPCMLLESEFKEGPTKVLLYFHGNSEDIGHENEAIAHLRKNINLIVIKIEYPGYGIYAS